MEKTTLYFWFLCIPIRLIAILVLAIIMQKRIVNEYYNDLRITAAVVLAFQTGGFFISDIIKREITVLGDAKWWISSIHGVMYAITFTLVIGKFEYAFVVLLVDVIYGALNWTNHYKK